ncbi:ATP synthase subunit C lysine N-methyltransferase-like [Nilaparvata lugens]|uniref:ATP synthase subunit C lysine N-methyltransferase-like n=1 Tax=Nilaparvata lugens TaxID=108931 RepID=UPI00193CE4A1|nr:ATP synthase subunit C lysine N-methyltransferase-like [Nilaparvata lugens]
MVLFAMENILNNTSTTNSVESNFKMTEKSKSFSTFGTALACITGGAAVLLTVISAPFVSPALRRICLPYVPATNAQVNNVLEALVGRKGRLIDLGSGDGRIVSTVYITIP